MTVDQAVELTRDAVTLMLVLGAPIMLVAVVVGLIISVLQAVTQLQDQTISFVPKIIAMTLAGLYILPWVLQHLVEYSTQLFVHAPTFL
jgi:flagellar biosynthetic protein FliQ